MDDDLQHLLNQLDPETPVISKAAPKTSPKASKASSQPPIEEDEEVSDSGAAWIEGVIDPSELISVDPSQSDLSKPDDAILFPTDVRNIDDIGSDSTTAFATLMDTPLAPAVPSIDLQKYLNRLDGVTDEILGACRSDRQEAQDVIQMFRQEIEQALNQSKAPSRMFIDGLVKAVEVKANINMTAVKMMEANAKMLASMKATTSVQVNNQNVSVTGNDHDLERILDEPMNADDEF